MDKTIGISELRKSLASIIKDVHEKGSRYIILQHSQAKAVLLNPDEMEILEGKTKRDPIKEVTSGVENNTKKKLSSYEKFFGKK
ncbi:MAG: type II toxin-antitoxin system Phd/YefM family antitoxin [Candidatus Aminicenantes bacterium]|nr:type II toxin-antitoxin system Phd/YefM family antitoxin [Candidatus Aminicenantes bacterium]